MSRRIRWALLLVLTACVALVVWLAVRDINGTLIQGTSDLPGQIPLVGEAMAGLPLRGPVNYVVLDGLRDNVAFVSCSLDVERLPLEGRFDGRQASEAIRAHTLDKASITGVYSLNPRVAAARPPEAGKAG